MNRGVAILVFLVAITIAGGVLTSGVGFELPILQQTSDPAASPFMATDIQAFRFTVLVLAVGAVVTGMGVTMGLVFWFLNKEVKVANEMPNLEELREQEENVALPEGKAKVA